MLKPFLQNFILAMTKPLTLYGGLAMSTEYVPPCTFNSRQYGALSLFIQPVF